MKATTKQVGGSHYTDMAIQPREYINANGLTWDEGMVIKYISRHRRKGGRKDLEKAIHCIQLMLEEEYGEDDVPTSNCSMSTSEPYVLPYVSRPYVYYNRAV